MIFINYGYYQPSGIPKKNNLKNAKSDIPGNVDDYNINKLFKVF